MKRINLAPTWKGILPALIELAANGETPEARTKANAELLRLADFADLLPSLFKTLEEKHKKANRSLEEIGRIIDPGESDPASIAEMLRKIGTIQAAALQGTAPTAPPEDFAQDVA